MNSQNEPAPATRRLRRRVGGVVAAVATLALLTTASGCGTGLNDLQDFTGPSLGGPGAKAVGAPSCDPPPSGPRSRRAAAGGLGAEEKDPFLSFILSVGGDAGSFGAGKGLGWLMNAISGGQPSQTQTEIDALTKDVDSRTLALQTQISGVCTLLDAKLDMLETNGTRDTYDGLAGQASTDTSQIRTWWGQYQDIVGALQKDPKVDDLSTDYLTDLANMRDNLTNTMNDLGDKLLPDPGGKEGMITVYAHLLSDQAGYSPTKVAQYPGTHVFPADYVSSANDMTDYYAGQLSLGLYLYSEVTHLAFPNVKNDARPYTVQPTYASDFATQVANDVHAFDKQISTGSDHYLTTGIGRIPAGTVLDYRDRSHPRLWSNTPVVLPGDAKATAGYCPIVSTFCYLNTYDKDGALGDVRVSRPSWAPVQTMIDATQWAGIDGWRVPTTDDWNAVQAGAGDDGLTATAHPTGMTIFDRTATTLHVKGADTTVQLIRPTLVNLGTSSASRYGLLTSTDAKDKALTGRIQKSDTTNAEGGSLFLVQDFTPPTSAAAPAQRLASALRPTPRRPHKGHHKGHKKHRGHMVGLPGPSVFDTATSCQAYTVPAGASGVTVTAIGGSGADGVQNGSATASGGRGGVVTATIPAASGTQLYVAVGKNGAGSTGNTNGGGSAGASDSILFGGKPSSGGAGGGFSAVSSYASCTSFLAVGGGGGGGGAGLSIPEAMQGGRGGDSCLVSGSSATKDGTCAAATDGAAHLKVTKGFSPYADSGGKAGGGPGKATGGAAGTAKPYEETTYDQPGTAPDGISGGTGGGYGSSQNHSFGGGGGGGAGYLGGGGGGGGGNIGAGGGGGGGTSFIANGLPQPGSFSLATKGQTPSVTITPVAKPVVLQSTASGYVANISGGVTTDGAPIIQYPRLGQPNEQWLVRPVSDTDPGELTIVNPAADKCLGASADTQGSQISLQTCNTKSSQRWRVARGDDGTTALVSALDAPGQGQFVLSTDRGAPTVFGASLVLAVDTSAAGQRWAVIDAGW